MANIFLKILNNNLNQENIKDKDSKIYDELNQDFYTKEINEKLIKKFRIIDVKKALVNTSNKSESSKVRKKVVKKKEKIKITIRKKLAKNSSEKSQKKGNEKTKKKVIKQRKRPINDFKKYKLLYERN